MFEKDHALSRRFQKIDVDEPSVEETVEILRGPEVAASRSTTASSMRRRRSLPRPSCRRATSTTATCRTRPSTSSTRPARRSASCPRPSRRKSSASSRSRRSSPRSRASRREACLTDDRESLKNLDRDLKAVVFGQDKAIDALAAAIKMARSRPGQADQADRLLPVLRPHRRRQDRGGAPARLLHGHRTDPLRHVRVHGTPRRVAPDRRAAGLRRLRPGRPADRGDHQEAALRAAAGRDREGPPGHLQHPAAGDGPRHADRQQRAQGRLPQRRHHHDHQCRRRGPEPDQHRLQPATHQPATNGRDQAHVHAGVPQPAGRDHFASPRSTTRSSCAWWTSS